MSNNEEKLEAWVKEKLEEYDNNPEFQAKRDKKHNDRDGYEGHLRKQVEAKLSGKNHSFSESVVHLGALQRMQTSQRTMGRLCQSNFTKR